jgi:hypothetical protein
MANGDPAVLLSAQGQDALARVAELRAGGSRTEMAAAAALRREFPADLAAAAMAQYELRAAAGDKFERAGQMLLTRGGYEQSSGEVIARYRAHRFRDAGLLGSGSRVADLCCGIGGDLIGLAAPGGPGRVPPVGEAEILAVDRDRLHARLALHNAGVYGADVSGGQVRACVADVRDIPAGAFRAVFIDPARRSDTRGGGSGPGRFRAGTSEPPLGWCVELADQVAAVCVKAAPGLPAELIPPGWEAEFIAVGRDLKEAVLWSPALATAPLAGVHGAAGGRTEGGPDASAGPRRATVLPGAHTLTAVPGDPVPVAEPGAYLLDPSPAVTRAGLVEDLARTLGARKIDERIAFCSADTAIVTPFARTLRVLHSAPWNKKRFAATLRELDVGAADIRRRGLAGDVDQIRRRLKLDGSRRATIVLTRVSDRPWGLICEDLAPLGLRPLRSRPLGSRLPEQDASHERGLPDVLRVVVDDTDQAYRQRDRRIPRAVDYPFQVGVRDRRYVLDRLLVGGIVVVGQERGGGADPGGDVRYLGGRMPVTDLHRVFRQPEPCGPAARLPHLRDAERGRDVIVLHPRQVPDQPADRVRVRVDTVGKLLRREPFHRAVHRFPDPVEGIGEQLSTGQCNHLVWRDVYEIAPTIRHAGIAMTAPRCHPRSRQTESPDSPSAPIPLTGHAGQTR